MADDTPIALADCARCGSPCYRTKLLCPHCTMMIESLVSPELRLLELGKLRMSMPEEVVQLLMKDFNLLPRKVDG